MDREDQQVADEGFGGFLDIFGDSGFAADAARDEAEEEDDPQAHVAADDSEPDEEDDGLSGEERVAANFAAIEDELGLTEEVEQPEDQLLGAQETDYSDLSKLSREELEALASESMGLKEKVTAASEEEVIRKVRVAEQQAVAQVQDQFEREVRTVSKEHYNAQFAQRLAAIIRNSANSDAFERDVIQAAVPLFGLMVDARLKYEEQKADEWESRIDQAVMEARKSVPELREVYAKSLLEANNLPTSAQAINAIMKTKSGRERETDDFQDRVAELVEMRDRYARQQQANTEKVRQEGKKRIAATAPKTSTQVRAKSRKPTAYKGEVEEGLRLLASLREG